MKIIASITIAAAVLATLAVPALSESVAVRKPVPLATTWTTSTAIEGSAPIVAAAWRTVGPRQVRVVYPGPAGRSPI